MPLPWIETQAFRQQVVLVVGAGRGIGEALAERFAEAGANVVVCDCVPERAQAVAERLQAAGRQAIACAADIGKLADIAALFGFVRTQFGRLDVLVNSAGFNRRTPLPETDEALWDQTQNVNLKGPYFCAKAAADLVGEAGGGRIVNLSSVGGYAAQKHLSAYNAAKGGLNLLTKSLALELAPQAITVNAVAPGAVEGPWNKQFFDDPEYRRKWMTTTPLRRMATNDDVAAAVMFFASREAAYITGQVLYVEGGKLSYVPSVDVFKESDS